MLNCAFVEWSSHDLAFSWNVSQVLPEPPKHSLCCAASAMAGTALIYPGWRYVNWDGCCVHPMGNCPGDDHCDCDFHLSGHADIPHAWR